MLPCVTTEATVRTSDEEPALARVVGKHCESGDIVVDRGVMTLR